MAPPRIKTSVDDVGTVEGVSTASIDLTIAKVTGSLTISDIDANYIFYSFDIK